METHHFSEAQLADFIEGRLTGAETAEIEAHRAAECPICVPTLLRYERLLTLLNEEPWTQPPEYLVHQAQALFRTSPVQVAAKRGGWEALRAIPAAPRRLVTVFALLALMVLLGTWYMAANRPVAQEALISMRGEGVVVQPSAAQNEAGDLPLRAGATVSNHSAEMLEITFFDGSVLQLEPRAVVKVVEMNASRNGDTKQIVLEQRIGKGWHRVMPVKGADSHYIVRTRRAEVEVHGTLFALEVEGSGTTHVAVVEGEVEVRSNDAPLVLLANESASVSERGEAQRVAVDTVAIQATAAALWPGLPGPALSGEPTSVPTVAAVMGGTPTPPVRPQPTTVVGAASPDATRTALVAATRVVQSTARPVSTVAAPNTSPVAPVATNLAPTVTRPPTTTSAPQLTSTSIPASTATTGSIPASPTVAQPSATRTATTRATASATRTATVPAPTATLRATTTSTRIPTPTVTSTLPATATSAPTPTSTSTATVTSVPTTSPTATVPTTTTPTATRTVRPTRTARATFTHPAQTPTRRPTRTPRATFTHPAQTPTPRAMQTAVPPATLTPLPTPLPLPTAAVTTEATAFGLMLHPRTSSSHTGTSLLESQVVQTINDVMELVTLVVAPPGEKVVKDEP